MTELYIITDPVSRVGFTIICVYLTMTCEDHALLLLTFDFVLGFIPSLGRTYILIVHEFPAPNLGTIPRLSVRLGEKH